MRGFTVVVGLALLAVTGCSMTQATTTASGEPTRTGLYARYDRVRGITEVAGHVFYRHKFMSTGPTVGLELHTAYPDSIQKRPIDDAVILFRSTTGTQTSTWQFLKSNDLVLLLNGSDRIRLEGTHDGSVGTILLKEAIAFRIPTADLARVGVASTVEGVLGDWRFELKPEEIARFREMALFARMDPSAPRPIWTQMR